MTTFAQILEFVNKGFITIIGKLDYLATQEIKNLRLSRKKLIEKGKNLRQLLISLYVYK